VVDCETWVNRGRKNRHLLRQTGLLRLGQCFAAPVPYRTLLTHHAASGGCGWRLTVNTSGIAVSFRTAENSTRRLRARSLLRRARLSPRSVESSLSRPAFGAVHSRAEPTVPLAHLIWGRGDGSAAAVMHASDLSIARSPFTQSTPCRGAVVLTTATATSLHTYVSPCLG
jgi:hypothetical protein